MPVIPTYVLLNQITLAAASSSVTFSNIPQNYGDLVLVVNASATTSTELKLRYNGDSGSNYPYVGVDNTYNETGTANSAANFMYLTTGNWLHIVQIFEYSSNSKNKTTLLRRNSPRQPSAAMEANRWSNNPAITSILLTTSSGSIATNSTISLYGVYA